MPPGVLTGKLLVASPVLADPNFERTVILVLEHSEEGAVGLILNRPSSVETALAVPDWAGAAAAPGVVFVGGPVSPGAAIALGRAANSPEEGWHPLFGEIGTVDLELDTELVRPMCPIRVFSGYAGWGPGQLDDELEAGGWIVAERDDADVLGAAPLELWAGVLRRQRWRIAMLAGYPRHLRAN